MILALEGKKINEEEEITKCMKDFNNLPTYAIEMIKKLILKCLILKLMLIKNVMKYVML